ncbi:MAG: hypothetical protein O9292_03160 [Rhodobacteraceae bacterium]|nr:hypothetical protein [Paracoccaceae bacterium]MCZ8151385.1 hypothetical protein [Paracoccaceae bacterium]MCZ8332703.1 hypothetical protein [Paracoccaceae bacterium]
MNVYHCLIELRTEARALSFAHSVGLWLDHLVDLQLVSGWRLMRRKFGLASGRHTDFVLEIEIKGLAALDDAFTALADADADAVELYEKMHAMIASVEIGLYRPYPDPSQRERIALI